MRIASLNYILAGALSCNIILFLRAFSRISPDKYPPWHTLFLCRFLQDFLFLFVFSRILSTSRACIVFINSRYYWEYPTKCHYLQLSGRLLPLLPIKEICQHLPIFPHGLCCAGSRIRPVKEKGSRTKPAASCIYSIPNPYIIFSSAERYGGAHLFFTMSALASWPIISPLRFSAPI